MKIIMLYGPSSSGKTTTINMVYDAIISQSFVVHPKRQLGGNSADFEAVLDYTKEDTTKRVAFFSMGDFAYEVVHAMSFYEGMGCEVLVCTCNDRFIVPTNRLKNRYDNVYPPIPKTVNRSDHKKANEQDANTIVQMI